MDDVDQRIVEVFGSKSIGLYRCNSCDFKFPYITKLVEILEPKLRCPFCSSEDISLTKQIKRHPVIDNEEIKRILLKIAGRILQLVSSGFIEDDVMAHNNISRIFLAANDKVINFVKLDTFEVVDVPYPYSEMVFNDPGIRLLMGVITGSFSYVVCKICGCPMPAENYFARYFDDGVACHVCGLNEFSEIIWLRELL